MKRTEKAETTERTERLVKTDVRGDGAWSRLYLSVISVLSVVSALSAGSARAQTGSPAGPIPIDRLAARRTALAARIGTGVAVLGSASQRDLETDYPQDSDYRERNDFFYLTGLEAPESWLVIVADSGTLANARLYLPARDSLAERWTGKRLSTKEAEAQSGIDDVRDVTKAAAEIRGLALGFTSPARRGALYIDRTESARQDTLLTGLVFAGRRDQQLPATRALAPEIAALRLVKDEDELRRLRRAIDITGESLVDAMQTVMPGMWEYEIEGVIEGGFRRRGAERVGFPSIVGSGPNSTTLHYDKSRRQTAAGDLAVLDVGAEYGYYTADVTRTVPINGKYSPRQRRIYDIVLGAQQAAIDSVRPGVTIGDLNRVARRYMRENSGDACGDKPCDQYFVHGLSHWLGMDVHDVGEYRTALAPNMVITVEPGIYIPAENLGVRIEDDVLVTPTGHELLSAKAPRKAEDIERIMNERGRAKAKR